MAELTRRLAHLAQDLRRADDGRVYSAGHGEEVFHSLPAHKAV